MTSSSTLSWVSIFCALVCTPTACCAAGTQPIVLLPGFDGSCLEMRRLLPVLEAAGANAWAVDIVGWGFSDANLAADARTVLGPDEKREHLLAFWQEQVSSIAMRLMGMKKCNCRFQHLGG